MDASLVRKSGWKRESWQVLKGGGKDLNGTNKMSEKGHSPTNLKRDASSSHQKNPDEVSPKRRKLLNEYKQRTPKKSPLKTPTKRQTPRLRCKNPLCRVGFSTARAKHQHERFMCPFLKSSPMEVLSGSSNKSAEFERNCRFCELVFSHARSRVRHEQNKHQTSASPISDPKIVSSPVNVEDSSSLPSNGKHPKANLDVV